MGNKGNRLIKLKHVAYQEVLRPLRSFGTSFRRGSPASAACRSPDLTSTVSTTRTGWTVLVAWWQRGATFWTMTFGVSTTASSVLIISKQPTWTHNNESSLRSFLNVSKARVFPLTMRLDLTRVAMWGISPLTTWSCKPKSLNSNAPSSNCFILPNRTVWLT